jgi:hypothetical protein
MKKDVRKYGTSNKRGRQPTSLDPFMSQASPKEPSLCISCKTVYQQKHWSLDPIAYQRLEKDSKTNRISCPACQKIAGRYPEGILTLSGSYLWEHEAEIQQILKNEEQKAMAKNPFERFIHKHRDGDKIIIETTEKKLAEHLGRVLLKSQQGTLDIAWSGSPEICRVSWQRML